MDKKWYAKPGSGGQGIVIDEASGRNIAVAYDEADAPTLAAAPQLGKALRLAVELLDDSRVRHFISSKLGEQARLHEALNLGRAALQEAE